MERVARRVSLRHQDAEHPFRAHRAGAEGGDDGAVDPAGHRHDGPAPPQLDADHSSRMWRDPFGLPLGSIRSTSRENMSGGSSNVRWRCSRLPVHGGRGGRPSLRHSSPQERHALGTDRTRPGQPTDDDLPSGVPSRPTGSRSMPTALRRHRPSQADRPSHLWRAGRAGPRPGRPPRGARDRSRQPRPPRTSEHAGNGRRRPCAQRARRHLRRGEPRLERRGPRRHRARSRVRQAFVWARDARGTRHWTGAHRPCVGGAP